MHVGRAHTHAHTHTHARAHTRTHAQQAQFDAGYVGDIARDDNHAKNDATTSLQVSCKVCQHRPVDWCFSLSLHLIFATALHDQNTSCLLALKPGHTNPHTHTHTRAHTRTRTHTHAHTRTHTHTQTHAQMHTQTHAQMHAQTHTHIRTFAHSHIRPHRFRFSAKTMTTALMMDANLATPTSKPALLDFTRSVQETVFYYSPPPFLINFPQTNSCSKNSALVGYPLLFGHAPLLLLPTAH